MRASVHKLTLVSVLLFSQILSAQDRGSDTITVNPKFPLDIEYDFRPWNKNPKEVETGFLIVRDSKSGRVAKIVLQETEPDSGVFIGQYVLTFAYDQTEVTPEIYTPPKSMIEKTDSIKAMTKLIESGALVRKPTLARKFKKGFQKLQIYDSREQAMEALEKLRNAGGKSPVDPSVLESQRRAAYEAEKLRLEEEAKRREQERLRLAELEAKRIEELRKEKDRLSAAEKAKRAEQAKKLSAEGMKLYAAENFTEAEKAFKQAAELDPSNRSFFFQYGITLYRLNKFNDSLVALKFAGDADVDKNQLSYYSGLNLMQLKEYKEALAKFTSVEESKDPALSPTAGFYAGVIEFTQENYPAAKKHFEFTIDNSQNNAQLDAQAESYIEQIAAILQFEEERKTKFIFSLNIGEQYDSNVLQVSNSGSAGNPTDKAGWRTLFMASAAYRPVYSQAHEFSGSLNYLDMYTMNDKFKSSSTLQAADPMMIGVSFPYKFKSAKYQLALTPGVEALYLNMDASGSRELLMNSNYVKADNTFVVSDSFFSNLNLEARTDDSVYTGTNNSDASKLTIASVNTKFVDKKKTTAWIGEFSYQMNNAKGDDEAYNKMELALGYLVPVFWESSMMTRLGWYSQIYPSHSSDRKDTNLGLTLALSKPFTPKISGSLVATYNQNASNVSTSEYDKYSLMTLFSWSFGL
ncbi:MAG: hypothetical protein AB7O96_04395 [Pseudobdellovibrionaceae bacterium]